MIAMRSADLDPKMLAIRMSGGLPMRFDGSSFANDLEPT